MIFFSIVGAKNSDFSIVATQFITSKVGIADCNFNFNFFFRKKPSESRKLHFYLVVLYRHRLLSKYETGPGRRMAALGDETESRK